MRRREAKRGRLGQPKREAHVLESVLEREGRRVRARGHQRTLELHHGRGHRAVVEHRDRLEADDNLEVAIMATGFTWDTQNRESDTQACREVWQEASRMLADPEVYLVVLDEISMVGRQFMGRIDSRLCQAKAAWNVTGQSLGGVSCVGVGDPAQCEAIMDQQIYDEEPHNATEQGTKTSKLSNTGLRIYAEFDEVVVLPTCHRVNTISKKDLSPDEVAYNARAQTFLQILHRHDQNHSAGSSASS